MFKLPFFSSCKCTMSMNMLSLCLNKNQRYFVTALKYRSYISDAGDIIDFSSQGTGFKQAGLSLALHSFVTDTTACQAGLLTQNSSNKSH